MSSEERPPCRDFERGVCNRGDKCRYYHPEGVNPAENGKLPICKDFQNKGCIRPKCKFLHVTVEEEAEYNKSGNLPSHGGRPESVPPPPGNGGAHHPIIGGGREMCKDFMNGVCDRGMRCKFSHQPQSAAMMSPNNYGKRYRDDFSGAGLGQGVNLAEENEMLRRKITDLQKQVIELREMNDTLYDQNTRYRNQLHGNAPPAGNPPPITEKTNGSATPGAQPAAFMMPYYSHLKY